MAENSTSIDEQFKKIFKLTCSRIQNGSLKKTALIDAVHYDKDGGLLALAIIRAGVDVNITDDSNKTALFYAAYNKSIDNGLLVAQKLIASGADVNIIDSAGETALFFAVINRNVKVVRALIDAGADVNTQNKTGESALFYACRDETGEICKALIEAGANVESTDEELIFAQNLITSGAGNIINSKGETALFFAVNHENVNVVRALIDAGADVNTQNKKGETALFYAGKDATGEISEVLLEAGANINITDKDGHTALFCAIMKRNGNMVRALVKAGLDVNKPFIGEAKDTVMPLMYAIRHTYNNESLISALAETADLTLTDNEGKTALVYAVNERSRSAVKALINAGADVNKTDVEGKTALFHAICNSNIDIVNMLIEAGSNVNMFDSRGKTPLFYAVEKDYDLSTASLLKAGAAVNARDSYGRTPLFFAIEKSRSLSLASYLLDQGADLFVKDDFNEDVFSLFVEKRCLDHSFNYYKFSISSHMSEALKLFKEKGVQIDTIHQATLNVMFSKILNSVYQFIQDNEDKYIQRFREVLETLIEFITEEGSRNILEEILLMLREFRISLLPKIFALLVKLGADPNSADSEGNTALHYATRLPFYGVSKETVMHLCQQLQSFGIRNRKNRSNETPLLFCFCGQFPTLKGVAEKEPRVKVLEEVVKFLLTSGSSMQEITHSEKSSFHLIFDIFQRSTFKSLLPGCNTFERRFTTKELMKVMVRVLNLIPYNDAHVMVHKRDSNFDGVLHLWATLRLTSPQGYAKTDDDGDLTFEEIMKMIFQYFLQCGAKVNDRNAKEETPLHRCVTWGAVKLLLEAGARPDDLDALGCSPLLHAAKTKLFLIKADYFYSDVSEEPKDFWKAVLNKGFDPWTADNDGESVLKILIESEQFTLTNALVEFALEDGYLQADTIASSLLTTICKDTSTSVHWKSILVETILKARNPIPLMNKAQGRDFPLHICCTNVVQGNKSRNHKNLKFLRKGVVQKVKPSVETEVNEETVHWKLLKLLLSYGADCSIPDETGRTCLDIAEDCPPLKDILMKPIDINEIIPCIPWTSASERYEHKLARVARRQESEHVDSFWYHKEPLANGSFGHVFAGINEKDGREVAIKRVETLRMGRREDLREISNLKSLADCEQVIRYLSYFEDDANHFSYVVLELMEGSLEEFLGTITFSLEIENSVKYCKDVVIGLRFLHNLEILHRDLKPSNILYKTHPELRLKIADFGLSRRIDSSATTVYGTNAGTRCWIAPEVMKSLQDHSKASDIFACGLVLHYILSMKRHPFGPSDVDKKSLFQMNNETEANIIGNSMRGWDNSLNSEATHLVKKMLVSDGTRRPSAAETLCHPFFWSKQKKTDLLTAVGNQPEFECPRAKRPSHLWTNVETDLQASFGTIVKHGEWNDPGYLYMPDIDKEMRKHPRSYDTHSTVELVRYIRNAYAHVSAQGRPSPKKKWLLTNFVFLEYFPNLVMEVYKAVITHGWDQTREEIKYVMEKN